MITGQTVKNTYTGDGVTREFTITFEFTDSSQVKFKVNGEDVTTNYSLNTVAKTLTYPTVASELDPLKSTDEITIYRDTSVTQDIEFSNGGPLNADMIEDGLDKLTMIAQEIKSSTTSEDSDIKILPEGTDIDEVLNEGEYWIKAVTCTSGFPSDLPTTQEGAYTETLTAIHAYIKVIDTETEATYPTVKKTQICFFYEQMVGSSTSSFFGAYIRELSTSTGYSKYWNNYNLLNRKRAIGCGINIGGTVYMPTKFYPNTSYFLGNFIKAGAGDPETIVSLTSLTLSSLPDSPYPIEFYFKTGETFSGITASQIKAWIGNTTLDTESAYKITIKNLIGTIEKLTVVE